MRLFKRIGSVAQLFTNAKPAGSCDFRNLEYYPTIKSLPSMHNVDCWFVHMLLYQKSFFSNYAPGSTGVFVGVEGCSGRGEDDDGMVDDGGVLEDAV